MLRNELYVGVKVWGRYKKGYRGGTKVRTETPECDWLRVDVPELRIITDELWSTVQATHRKPAPGTVVAERRVSVGGWPAINLLSTVMRCGECGGPMKARTHRVGSEKTKAYTCSNYAVGKLGCKNSLRRPVDVVNETVVTWLLANVLRPENASAVFDEVERILVAQAKGEHGKGRELEESVTRTRQRIARLAEAIAEAPREVRSVLYAKLREEQTTLATVEHRRSDAARTPSAVREQLEKLRADAAERLAVFQAAITGNPEQARRIMAAVFPNGIVASPVVRGERRRFWLDGEASFGVLFSGDTGGPTGIPDVASPRGFEPLLAK